MANAYQSTGIYNDYELSDADRAKVAALKQQWQAASSAGDAAGMDSAHAGAEAIRAQYGYSGGGDGSEYNLLESEALKQPAYSANKLQSATSADGYINSLYNARQAAALNALKAAYEQNVQTLDSADERLPLEYQAARNKTVAAGELDRKNFNEYAAAYGLNSGAGGQAHLAMGNAAQSKLSGINRAEADARANLQFDRARLETAYKNDITQAVAAGNLQRAQALYSEYVRVDNSFVDTSRAQGDESFRAYTARADSYRQNQQGLADRAKLLAQYGDFSGYAELGFSEEQIGVLQNAYRNGVR